MIRSTHTPMLIVLYQVSHRSIVHFGLHTQSFFSSGLLPFTPSSREGVTRVFRRVEPPATRGQSFADSPAHLENWTLKIDSSIVVACTVRVVFLRTCNYCRSMCFSSDTYSMDTQEWRRRRDEGNARRNSGSVAVKVSAYDFATPNRAHYRRRRVLVIV